MESVSGARLAAVLMISGVMHLVLISAVVAESPSAMPGFSWLVDQRLAGMPRPGSGRALEEDMRYLEEQGIRVLVSLTEQSIDIDVAERHGIEVLHMPIADFTAPTLAQVEGFLRVVDDALADDRAVGVHCAAGQGRTGTFLAAYLVAIGDDAAEAIAEVRRLRPGSIETRAQENMLFELARQKRRE